VIIVATPNWPFDSTTVPYYVDNNNYMEEQESGLLRTTIDQGLQTQRVRYTAVSKNRSVVYHMTAAQKQTLEDFWWTTLKGGALPFYWYAPVTGDLVLVRFAGIKPEFSTQDGYNWRVTCVLEIIE
jgi:hypothetical protein